MKLGLDIRESTVGLTLLSRSFPDGFMGMQAFSWTPAPWILPWKALNILFSSGCSPDVCLTFGYGLLLLRTQKRGRTVELVERDHLQEEANTTGLARDGTGRQESSALYQTLAVRTGHKRLTVWAGAEAEVSNNFSCETSQPSVMSWDPSN